MEDKKKEELQKELQALAEKAYKEGYSISVTHNVSLVKMPEPKK